MATYTIEKGFKGKRSFKKPLLMVLVGVLVLGSGYVAQNISPAAKTIASTASPLVSAESSHLTVTQPITWPSYGQAAYGVVGEGVLASSKNNAQTVPTASLAKIITALAVLKEKPLKPGEQGPMITITQEDIAIYENYVRNDGSVVPVELGEQISQYQALQAMLLPSANNISDALVRWAFGSTEAYTAYANNMLKDLKITNTHITDASGFSAGTTSTASDMVQLGIVYLQNPVLKEIAQQPEATIPVAGKIKNYNSTLNKNGILGIKVGNTDEAGRCFVVADIRDGSKPPSVVAILGASSLQTAMADGVIAIHSGDAAYDAAVANRP